jgi:hypothetical protein
MERVLGWAVPIIGGTRRLGRRDGGAHAGSVAGKFLKFTYELGSRPCRLSTTTQAGPAGYRAAGRTAQLKG